MARGRRHIVIPDTQIKPGVPLDHLHWIAQYIVDKKPDVLVIIGDWADMPSLSSYDINTKSSEGRTYRDDILAANDGLQRLMAPIQAEMERLERRRKTKWKLRKVVTLGNHEDRITRTIEKDRKLDGTLSLDDLFFKQWGFEVYPFREVVTVDGIGYCHYFPSGPKGLPCGSARQILQKHHMSCFAGHLQGKDIAFARKADGARLTAIIAGSCYLHDEPFMGPLGNKHFRGIFVLNEVENGSFDDMAVSLDFLKDRYEKRQAAKPHPAHWKPGHKVVVDLELPRSIPDSPGLPETPEA
jgi:hypothetical protein